MENKSNLIQVKSSLWSNIFKTSSDDVKIISLLKKFPAFSELRKKELREIKRIVQVREYLPNEVIFFEGDPGVAMFIIESGKVEISHTFKSGLKQELAILFSGDFFGEITVLTEGLRTATATALTETRLLIIFRPDLLELIHKDPELGVKILLGFTQILVEKLRILNQDYLNLYDLIQMEKKS